MANGMSPDGDRRVKEVKVSEAFRPSAPIDRAELFAGRNDEIRTILDVVNQPGQHAVVYGERGVGKTSLINVLPELLATAGRADIIATKVNCDSTDSFESIWQKVLQEIEFSLPIRQLGFLPGSELQKFSLGNTVAPGSIITSNWLRRAFRELGLPVIVIIDEFDRLKNAEEARLFADTIKTFSDYDVKATIILVGVGQTINDLISEHQSIDRALVQIDLARMQQAELEVILEKGATHASISFEPDVMKRIAIVSQGLAHYTHLLGLYSCREAIGAGKNVVGHKELFDALTQAVEKSQQSIVSEYTEAVKSNDPRSIYEEVLLACTFAPLDDLGMFTTGGVRQPLSIIRGKNYTISHYAHHLDEFSSAKRRNVLIKTGEPRRRRFQFTDPLMEPFVIIHGLAIRMVEEDQFEALIRYNDGQELEGLGLPDEQSAKTELRSR